MKHVETLGYMAMILLLDHFPCGIISSNMKENKFRDLQEK